MILCRRLTNPMRESKWQTLVEMFCNSELNPYYLIEIK